MYHVYIKYLLTGPPREILQGEQDCFGAPGIGLDFSQIMN